MTTILIIDNDNKSRNFIAEIFQHEGYATIGSAAIDEGLKKISENKISLVLLDIDIAESNGVKLIEKIKILKKPTIHALFILMMFVFVIITFYKKR